MKKISILLLLLVPTFSVAQLSQEQIDEMVNTMEFYLEFFDVETKQKLEDFAEIKADSVGVKYFLVIHNSIAMDHYEVARRKDESNYELKFAKDYYAQNVRQGKISRTFCIAEGVLIPSKRGALKVESKEMLVLFRKPTGGKDFFAGTILEKEPTQLRLKSKPFTLVFQ